MILPHSPFVPTPDSPEWRDTSRRYENDTAYFADILPTLADVAGIKSSSYYTDGKSFINILKGKNKKTDKNEIFIHYTPRWGWPSANNQHSRWVMNSNYKLYRDGRFFNTVKNPLEKETLDNLSDNE